MCSQAVEMSWAATEQGRASERHAAKVAKGMAAGAEGRRQRGGAGARATWLACSLVQPSPARHCAGVHPTSHCLIRQVDARTCLRFLAEPAVSWPLVARGGLPTGRTQQQQRHSDESRKKEKAKTRTRESVRKTGEREWEEEGGNVRAPGGSASRRVARLSCAGTAARILRVPRRPPRPAGKCAAKQPQQKARS